MILLLAMDSETKNYEISYLLPPSILDEEVLTWSGKLAVLIEEQHGAIRKAEAPRKWQLSYPINKNKTAYFGWTTFTIDPAAIKIIDKKLKTEKNFLRFLIVEEEIEKLTPIFRLVTPRPSRSRPITPPLSKPEEKLDLEALDRKLEEILGK